MHTSVILKVCCEKRTGVFSLLIVEIKSLLETPYNTFDLEPWNRDGADNDQFDIRVYWVRVLPLNFQAPAINGRPGDVRYDRKPNVKLAHVAVTRNFRKFYREPF